METAKNQRKLLCAMFLSPVVAVNVDTSPCAPVGRYSSRTAMVANHPPAPICRFCDNTITQGAVYLVGSAEPRPRCPDFAACSFRALLRCDLFPQDVMPPVPPFINDPLEPLPLTTEFQDRVEFTSPLFPGVAFPVSMPWFDICARCGATRPEEDVTEVLVQRGDERGAWITVCAQHVVCTRTPTNN